MDHGLGDIRALLIVPNQAAPVHHPAKRALSHPAPGQHLKAHLLQVPPAAHPFSDEAQRLDLAHQPQPERTR